MPSLLECIGNSVACKIGLLCQVLPTQYCDWSKSVYKVQSIGFGLCQVLGVLVVRLEYVHIQWTLYSVESVSSAHLSKVDKFSGPSRTCIQYDNSLMWTTTIYFSK